MNNTALKALEIFCSGPAGPNNLHPMDMERWFEYVYAAYEDCYENYDMNIAVYTEEFGDIMHEYSDEFVPSPDDEDIEKLTLELEYGLYLLEYRPKDYPNNELYYFKQN